MDHVSHRPYSTGFYYGAPGQYYETSRYIREWQVVALVIDCDESGNATLSLRNKLDVYKRQQQDYTGGMSFPTPEKASRIGESGPWAIELRPVWGLSLIHI